ncbi:MULTISPECIES: hypothetical protein [Helicobacter]|uniref:Uncharacterized protein n=2 Tax=Helicobacter suis TaxID=104628 RepID=A0A510HH68_9HELI|nr:MULTISPECIES: hypothetical protein [Helicobacter]CRF49702.1 hypothetical protein HHE03_13630 [Helicobacter heilmannii]BCD45674.1 hypothetical protein NHP190020_07130 [Helicobacter suis]BCD46715.1 hypothetical protein NHP190020_17540 [Helicobacter suis]BCD47377.1 hypothetical protein NHP194003_05810 [Helicobacter suis]BCD48489.1 hypothetical protein NHP194003_16930 [Helicobacter suis]
MAKAILETSGKCESNTSYALIEANRVKDIFKGSSLPSYNTQHIKLFALPAGEEYKYAIGQALNENGELEELSLDQAKAMQISKVISAFELEVARVQKEYIPLDEVLTFELQYQEAMLGITQNTPFINELAKVRGENRIDLINKIKEKHETYTTKLATLLGSKAKAVKQIENASNIEEVIKINYSAPQPTT